MDRKIKRLFEFDGFRVDPDQKCLWQGSELVSLTPKAFDTLVVLVENYGQVVSKETLLNEVWADTFVEESTLAQNISTLRKVFTGRQFIETIPRRGYRFVGEVNEFFDDEIVVVEKMTQTRIIAEREEIHDSNSDETNLAKTILTLRKSVLSKTLITAIVLILVTITVGGILVFRYYASANNSFENKFRQFETTKIASSGNIYRMAFSPDGRYLALVEKNGETQTLLVKQTTSTNLIEIVPPTKDDFAGVTFSPDGQSIYYTLHQQNNSLPAPKIGTVYRVPILGGIRNEIVKDADSPVAFSPTEPHKIAFVRHAPQLRESAIIAVDLNNGTEQKISTRLFRDRYLNEGISWSPDGRFIAGGAYNSNNKTSPYELVVINVSNGEQNTFSPLDWSWMGQVTWLKDSGILLIGFTDKSPNFTDEIWLVSYPEGKVRSIANGISGAYGFGVSEDTKTIVATRVERASGLLIASPDKLSEASIINKKIGDNSLLNLGISTTNDGKIVYSSTQQNNDADIWTVNSDGTDLKQLTNEAGVDFSPVVSPEGNYLVFASNRKGLTNIWRANMDGNNPKQLTESPSVSPSISPDGKWVYFSGNKGKNTIPLLYKISIEGGEPTQLTNFTTILPQISPDGKYIACLFPEINKDNQPTNSMRPTILSAADGSLIKQFSFGSPGANLLISWTPDSKAISYVLTENEKSKLWIQPIDGGQAKKITDLQPDEIFRYAWLKNSEKLVMEKGMRIKEVLLIRDTAK